MGRRLIWRNSSCQAQLSDFQVPVIVTSPFLSHKPLTKVTQPLHYIIIISSRTPHTSPAKPQTKQHIHIIADSKLAAAWPDSQTHIGESDLVDSADHFVSCNIWICHLASGTDLLVGPKIKRTAHASEKQYD